jgi:pimeloyl-ACP methyl ester carboxylesterase
MLVDLPDGRQLEYVVDGPETGLPLVFHHGTPGAAVPYPPHVSAAAERGLRTVTYARPGYGASTPQPGRTVADAVADTTALLDALDAQRFVTVGWSGGGPHALACAILAADRCAAAASLAGVAPYDAPGLAWTAGMGTENVAEFSAAAAGPAALTSFLEPVGPLLAVVQGPDLEKSLGDLLSTVDIQQLTPDFADHLARTFRAALAPGIAGWRDDDLAFVRDWGFELRPGAPVALWQGEQDRMVPYAHGQWLAGHVAGVRAHLLPEQGHLSLMIDRYDAILDDLLTLADAA